MTDLGAAAPRAIIGISTAAISDATEAVRVSSKVPIQTKKEMVTATGANAIKVPAAVATPFPPRNFVYTGHTWPAIAAIP